MKFDIEYFVQNLCGNMKFDIEYFFPKSMGKHEV